MSIEHLIEGLDPTPLPCISKADILQMIRAAKPVTDEGWIHWSATAPDVVANPEMATFLWGEVISGDRTSNIYYYDGSTWQLIPLTILDGSITLSKISLVGSTPYYIIQVNAARNALVWTSIVNAIQDNTIPPIKLLVPNNTDTFLMASFAGVKNFVELIAFFAAIANNAIPVSKLIKGTANQVLKTNSGGTLSVWGTIDVSELTATGYLAGQSIRRNVGNTAWEGFTPAIQALPTFIAPVTVYTGAAVSWTTYSASSVTLTGKYAAIVQAEIVWNDAADGNAEVDCRKDGGGATLLVTKGASVDAFQVGAQAIIPLTTDGKFDYRVIFSGGATLAATIKLIGYIG